MENVGCVTLVEKLIFRSKTADAAQQRAEVILHELAHMWFGDLVTMRWWDDLWLNESFATYASYHALTKATRFTDAWATFASQLKGRSEEHTSELQSRGHLVCRHLLEKKKIDKKGNEPVKQ